MWTRQDLKTKAKAAFKANYWFCVIVALVLTIITGAGTAYTGSYAGSSVKNLDKTMTESVDSTVSEQLKESFNSNTLTINGKTFDFDGDFSVAKINDTLNEVTSALNSGSLNINGEDIDISDPEDLQKALEVTSALQDVVSSLEGYSNDDIAAMLFVALGAIAGVLAIMAIISFIVSLIFFYPLSVGCHSFFARNSCEKAPLGEVGKGFSPHWGRNIGAMFLVRLFTFLWSLLFIIPGIVKSYSYRMVPYILAEDPNVGAAEAITRSRNMMNGQKWNAFVLDLSFIGWFLLTAVTFGLLGIFYVYPYKYSTDAQLYHAIKNNVPA